MSPFNRAHMASYSSLIESVYLSGTVFELYQVTCICRKSPVLAYPSAFDAPAGVTPFKFHQDLWHKKTRVLGLSCSLFSCSAFSHFIRTLTCDGQTDGQTNTQRQYTPL